MRKLDVNPLGQQPQEHMPVAAKVRCTLLRALQLGAAELNEVRVELRPCLPLQHVAAARAEGGRPEGRHLPQRSRQLLAARRGAVWQLLQQLGVAAVLGGKMEAWDTLVDCRRRQSRFIEDSCKQVQYEACASGITHVAFVCNSIAQ